MSKEYSFFSHTKCEYFPCHKNADKDNFNCLFCYCPLYLYGEKCGGDFVILKNGIKDCTGCIYPHKRENYDSIIQRLRERKQL